MKVDEAFKNCFSHNEIEGVLDITVRSDLKAGKVVVFDWENKKFRPSLVYCIINYVVREVGLSGFKKRVKFENVSDEQKKLLRLCLAGVTSMWD